MHAHASFSIEGFGDPRYEVSDSESLMDGWDKVKDDQLGAGEGKNSDASWLRVRIGES